jgi:hypothetical protein
VEEIDTLPNSFQRWQRIRESGAAIKEDGHGALLHSILFIVEMPQGCEKVLGYRKWLSWFSAKVRSWCQVAPSCVGDQRQVSVQMNVPTNGVRHGK